MDLQAAITKHADWKTRLRKAIDGHERLDAATIKSDSCCDLGKWLHGAGKTQFGAMQSHSACLRQHAAFHAEAGKVAAAINGGKFAEALGMIGSGSPYAAASSAVGVAILRLKKEAGI